MAHLLSKRRVAWALGLAALAGISCAFLSANRARSMTDPAQARLEGRPIPVRTAFVEEKEVSQVVGATAVTVPSFTSVIRIPPTAGLSVRYVPAVTDMVIKTVHVEDGDYVRRGQVLFETDNEVFKQLLVQRKSALDAAEAQLERVKRSLNYSQTIRERELASAQSEVKFRTEELDSRSHLFQMDKRLQANQTLSQPDYYETRSRHERATFELLEAQRRTKRAKESLEVGPFEDHEELARAIRERDWARVDYEETRRAVEQSKITSPIDGFIDGKVDVVHGQTVEVTTALARVYQLDPIHVRLDVPQERIDDVSIGQKAEVVLDSFPGETFVGTVIRCSAHVNPQLRVFPAVVELGNPKLRIKSGVSGFARLRKGKVARTVPASAVIQHGGRAMAFRVEEGRARLREIRVGRPVEVGELEVTDGLAAGDEVVVYFSNFYRHWGNVTRLDAYLQHNDLVDTDWRKWARRD